MLSQKHFYIIWWSCRDKISYYSLKKWLVDETEVETLSQMVQNLEFRKFFPAGPDLHSNCCQMKKRLQTLFKQQKDSCCARSSNSVQFLSGRDENGRNVLIIWERGWNWLRFTLLDDQVAKNFFGRKKSFQLLVTANENQFNGNLLQKSKPIRDSRVCEECQCLAGNEIFLRINRRMLLTSFPLHLFLPTQN